MLSHLLLQITDLHYSYDRQLRDMVYKAYTILSGTQHRQGDILTSYAQFSYRMAYALLLCYASLQSACSLAAQQQYTIRYRKQASGTGFWVAAADTVNNIKHASTCQMLPSLVHKPSPPPSPPHTHTHNDAHPDTHVHAHLKILVEVQGWYAHLLHAAYSSMHKLTFDWSCLSCAVPVLIVLI